MEQPGVGGVWPDRPRAFRRWASRLALCLGLLAAGTGGWSAEPSRAARSPRSCEEETWGEASLAELTFAEPRWFVRIVAPGHTERLYGIGDAMAGTALAGASVRILRIEPGRVEVRDPRGATTAWLAPGDAVPGRSEHVVAETTFLHGLSFHYRVAERSPDPEPRLLCIQGTRAHLEVPVPRAGGQRPAAGEFAASPAERATSVGYPLDHVPREGKPAVAVAPHTYEVGANDLQDLLDQGERQVTEAWVGGGHSMPTPGGESQAITSPVADGTLEPRGFRLTSPKWAEAAGLETGDLILAVDGRAVNTLGDLFQASQQLRQAARRPRFEVTLEREGVQVTKTFLIR